MAASIPMSILPVNKNQKRLRFSIGQFHHGDFCDGKLVPDGDVQPCTRCHGTHFEPIQPNRLRCTECKLEYRAVVTDGERPIILIAPECVPLGANESPLCSVEAHISLWTPKSRALACAVGGEVCNLPGMTQLSVEETIRGDTVLNVFFEVPVQVQAQEDPEAARARILALPEYVTALDELALAAERAAGQTYTITILR